jgi:hypothetical protein
MSNEDLTRTISSALNIPNSDFAKLNRRGRAYAQIELGPAYKSLMFGSPGTDHHRTSLPLLSEGNNSKVAKAAHKRTPGSVRLMCKGQLR